MIDYFITPLVLMVLGMALTLFPPGKRMSKYGYRTKTSLKSQENWDLAQRLSGKYLTFLALISGAINVLLFFNYPGNHSRLMAVLLPVIGIFVVIRLVESRLDQS